MVLNIRSEHKMPRYSMIDSEEFIAFNFQIFSRIIPFQITMKSVPKKPSVLFFTTSEMSRVLIKDIYIY